MHRTEPLGGTGDRGPDRPGVGDVDPLVHHLAAESADPLHLGPLRAVRLAPAEPDDPGPVLLAEVSGELDADPAGAADDHVHAALAVPGDGCDGHRRQRPQVPLATAHDGRPALGVRGLAEDRGDPIGHRVEPGDVHTGHPGVRELGRGDLGEPVHGRRHRVVAGAAGDRVGVRGDHPQGAHP